MTTTSPLPHEFQKTYLARRQRTLNDIKSAGYPFWAEFIDDKPLDVLEAVLSLCLRKRDVIQQLIVLRVNVLGIQLNAEQRALMWTFSMTELEDMLRVVSSDEI